MNFVSAVGSCFRQYVGFSGKASRSEFWWFQLFAILVVAVAVVLQVYDISHTISGIAILIVLLPSWAVSVRRLHDVGRSSWWLMLTCTVIGDLVLLYWFLKPSKK